MAKDKYKYERMYYLIGPYDVVYGRFEKFRLAKNHYLEMSRAGAVIHKLKPGIYKSCEQPAYEYDRNTIKYIEKDQVWAYLYYSWEDYVEDTLRQYKKGKFGYLLEDTLV